MALQNGCTGQELITEINNMKTSGAQYQENTDNRLEELKTDGFHIGDVRHSFRNSLGDNYLLCNGANVTSYNGYSKLVDTLQGSGMPWYCYVDNLTSTTKTYKECFYCYENSIYHFYPVFEETVMKVILREYANYQSFVDGNYTKEYHIHSIENIVLSTVGYGEHFGIRMAKIFNGKLFLCLSYVKKIDSYTSRTIYSVQCADLTYEGSNIVTSGWKTVNSVNREDYMFVDMCVSSNLSGLLVVIGTCDSYNNKSNIYCTYTSDGETYISKSKMDVQASTGSAIHERLRSLYLSCCNNEWVIRCTLDDNYSRPAIYTIKSDIELSNEFGGTSSSIGYEAKSKTVYYDNNKWSKRLDVNTGYYELLCGGQVVLNNTNSGSLSVRKSKFFNGDLIYENGEFRKLTMEERREYGFDKTNSMYEIEGDDIYLSVIQNPSNSLQYLTSIIPKTFTVSMLPTISYDSGYGYIKAKE